MKDRRPRVRLAVSAASTVLVLGLYLLRPDAAQALHWWPMVFWTPIVLLPFLTLRPRGVFRAFGLALVLWISALHVVREPALSAFLPAGPREGLRIVSLNCAGGTRDAAREAFARGADLVLLQEVGGREEFVRAGKAAGYPYVSWSVDDAVFARTPITDPAKSIDFAAGTVEIEGRKIRVVALRLRPPVFRLDLYDPGCWREYATDVARRRARMKALLDEARAEGTCLVGGDFNATNPRLVTDARPAWAEAGASAIRGWRGTGTNDDPFVWTDQIWASPDLRWNQSQVRKTEHSDHRMVIADFAFR